jgi:hypothetical protein
MKYQFTMYSEKCKPVSCIVEAETRQDFIVGDRPAYKKAIQKIMVKRGWTLKDLAEYGYGKSQIRKVE